MIESVTQAGKTIGSAVFVGCGSGVFVDGASVGFGVLVGVVRFVAQAESRKNASILKRSDNFIASLFLTAMTQALNRANSITP